MQIDPGKLVQARLASAMSQEEAAMAADLSTRTIQRIEAGHPASLESTKALLTIFGADIICEPQAQHTNAECSPWALVAAQIGRASRRGAWAGFAGLRLLFAVNFVLVALAKLVVPGQTGLFVGGEGFVIGAMRRAPANTAEVLGYWIIPLMLAAAAAVMLTFAPVRQRLFAA